MVQINDFRVSSDAKYLVIDVSIPDLSYYRNVYLDKIKVDTQKTYTSIGPSEVPCYEYSSEIDENKTNLKVKVPKENLIGASLEKDIFILYVTTKGVPTEDIPCREDVKYTTAVAFYDCFIYTRLMEHVKEINQTCTIPKAFIDDYLNFVALNISAKSNNISEAVYMFNNLFGKNKDVVINKCNLCNG